MTSCGWNDLGGFKLVPFPWTWGWNTGGVQLAEHVVWRGNFWSAHDLGMCRSVKLPGVCVESSLVKGSNRCFASRMPQLQNLEGHSLVCPLLLDAFFPRWWPSARVWLCMSACFVQLWKLKTDLGFVFPGHRRWQLHLFPYQTQWWSLTPYLLRGQCWSPRCFSSIKLCFCFWCLAWTLKEQIQISSGRDCRFLVFSSGHASPLSIDSWLENCFLFICETLLCKPSRAVEKPSQVCGRNLWKDVKHPETALTQQSSELQVPGNSAAAGAPKKQHFCLLCISTLPWGRALGLCWKQGTVTWPFGLGAVALYPLSSFAEGIPLASFHRVPSGFKAKCEEGKPTIQRGTFRKIQM